MTDHVGPNRYIGWVCYFSVEAYGSLMVAIFWSFTNSIMDLEQAKGTDNTYAIIIRGTIHHSYIHTEQ